MAIQLTSDNIDISPSMHELVKEKLKKMQNRLVDIPEDLQNIRVVLNKGSGETKFLAKIELHLKGKNLFAEEESYSIESALVSTVEKMDRQITKAKDKRRGV